MTTNIIRYEYDTTVLNILDEIKNYFRNPRENEIQCKKGNDQFLLSLFEPTIAEFETTQPSVTEWYLSNMANITKEDPEHPGYAPVLAEKALNLLQQKEELTHPALEKFAKQKGIKFNLNWSQES